jgi:uncharacterized protein (DUF2345 family)
MTAGSIARPAEVVAEISATTRLAEEIAARACQAFAAPLDTAHAGDG